ncbi:MAG: hypothetical protein V3574_01425 [Candidatus Moraniibacteriota bacterium]
MKIKSLKNKLNRRNSISTALIVVFISFAGGKFWDKIVPPQGTIPNKPLYVTLVPEKPLIKSSIVEYNNKDTNEVITWESNHSSVVPSDVGEYWGPDRLLFTIANPPGYVTFNSITDNPAHGDERNFMQVREANASNENYADAISLNVGHEYVVYVYYHNNGACNLSNDGEGAAYGAYVKVEIPATVASGSQDTKAIGYIGANNASPALVWNDIRFSNVTGDDIALRYVSGSATIHSFGSVDGQVMSDTIVTTGAHLGYNNLDGMLPSCKRYAGYITFRIKTMKN